PNCIISHYQSSTRTFHAIFRPVTKSHESWTSLSEISELCIMQLEWTKINDSFPFSYLLSFLGFYLNYTNSFFKSYEPRNLNFVFSDQTSDELSRPEFQRCPSFLN
ncbi:hypothetical protein LINGRAHAP2_LOCUS23573, partial [Linum grandiflorum]